ncbi:Retrovirus-related Pol polyprotein from transposon 17.6, partial [Dictyocoela roeselum]
APSTFQRVMNTIFDGVNNVMIYMNDILLFTNTPEEHKRLLEKVFKILNKHPISINFDKCKFNETEFLGHKINKDGITSIISKLESYKSFIPKTKKKQLQKQL